MKARRLLAAFIASAMVLGTMSFPAFAEDEAQTAPDETVLEVESTDDTEVLTVAEETEETQPSTETSAPEIPAVAQIDGVTYSTLAEAVQAAQVGNTIELVSDISDISTVEIGEDKDITLDLKGYRIDAAVRSDNAAKHYYAIDNYGTFTLTDTVGGGVISARGIENLGNGKMIINGGTIKSIDTNGGASIWNVADLTINGGTFETTHVGESSDSVGIGCLNNSGTALITAGNFIDVNARTYAIISTGHIEITPADGKTVEVTGKHGALAVDAGTAVVNGGNYSSTDYYGLYVSNDGLGTDPMTAAVTVNGGTFDGPNYSVWIGSDYNNPVNSTIEIVGGTYKKPLNAQECTREGAISVKGGTFSAAVSGYVAADYYQTQNEDGTYTVSPKQAAIGGTKYNTLNEAVAAAESGATVKLLDNAEGSGVMIEAAEAKNITIDLGGHTYTVTKDPVGSPKTKNQAFHLEKGSNITIQNGTITSTSDSGVKMLVQNYCNLTLDGVTLDGTNLPGNNRYVMSNNFSNTVLKGNTNIIARDGDVAFDVYNWKPTYDSVSVTLDETMTGTIQGKIEFATTEAESNPDTHKLVIKGGSFTDTDVRIVLADNYNNPTTKSIDNFIESRYAKTQLADGKYQVLPVVAKVDETGYATLQDAVNEAQENSGTVTLVDDVNVTNRTLITKTVTLDLNGHTIMSDNATAIYLNPNTNASLTLNDSSEQGAGVIQANNGKYPVSCGSDSTMIINGGHIIGEVFGIVCWDNTSLTINGGTVTATAEESAAISGNGTAHNTVFTINGGTISGRELGIYHPQNGKLTINGGTITGGKTGIEIRAGEAIVKNGTIEGNGIPTDSTPNGNGSTTVGAGIAVVQHTSQLPTSLTVNGGTISGYTTIFQKNIEENPAEAVAKVSLNLNGGKYNVINGGSAVVFSENKTGFVSGGTYAIEPDGKYLANGYYSKKNNDGTYSVLTKSTIIDTAKTTGAEITLDNLNNNAAIDHEADATYKVVVSTAPKADVEKANGAIAATADNNTDKAIFDISVEKTDSNGTTTVLDGENGVTQQKVTITLGETPKTDSTVYVYHVKDNGDVEKMRDVTVSSNKVTFTAPSFSTYAVTYTPVEMDANDITTNVNVVFSRVPGSRNQYYITLKANEAGKKINRFMSADLAFKNDCSTVDYDIKAATNMDVTLQSVSSDNKSREYHFKMDGIGASSATGEGITIGTITFSGYGRLDFSVDNTYDSEHSINIVNTAKVSDNIVDNYTVAGSTLLVNESVADNLATDESGKITDTISPETKRLEINVAGNNAFGNNEVAYQDMTVEISGGDLLATKTIHLGLNPTLENIDSENINVSFNTSNSTYTIGLDNELTLNTSYTVTVKGAGYRTARYTVRMTKDKTLNFWNNVKDNDTVVEVGEDASEVKTNFLAGDIVKDNDINIYDLSAVVSYFGESAPNRNNVWNNAKYDLNRDGKIDSKDVAYVLVSWGN